MTAQEFSEYRGKNVMIDGITFPILGYEKGVDSDTLIVGVSKDIIEKETDSPEISTAWKTLGDDDVIEKECDYYSYAPTDKVIMTAKELNLCELLKGCEGMVFYSTMVGYCRLIEITEYITIGYGDDDYVFLESDGKYAIDGECTLFPSKYNRDWSTFVKPINVKEGDPVMTKWNSAAFWKLESYAKDNKSDFIVPISDFDFTDFDSNKSKSIV